MTATRRGVIRSAVAALFAPAAPVDAMAELPSSPGLLRRQFQILADERQRLDEWQSVLAYRQETFEMWAENLASNQADCLCQHLETRRWQASLTRRERMLDLRERFVDTWPRWLDWSEVSDWGGALAAMGEFNG